MAYRLTTEFWRGFRLKLQLSINPPKDNSEYVTRSTSTQRVRGKDGSLTTLVFSPRMYLKLYPTGSFEVNPNTIGIPMAMVASFSLQLEKVYKDIVDTPEMYVYDENKMLQMDHNLAMKKAKGLSVYTDKLVLVPSVVPDATKNVRGIKLLCSGGEIGSISLPETSALINRLNTIDPFAIQILLAIVEEQHITNKKLDRIETKIDDLLKAIRGSSSSGTAPSGLGEPRQINRRYY